MLENMGERLCDVCVFTASLLGQEAALHVSRVQIGTPGDAVKAISTQPMASGRCTEYVDALFGLL